MRKHGFYRKVKLLRLSQFQNHPIRRTIATMSKPNVSPIILLIMSVSMLIVLVNGQGTGSQSSLRGNQYDPRVSYELSSDETSQDSIRLRGTVQSQIQSLVHHQHNAQNGDDNSNTKNDINNDNNKGTTIASLKNLETVNTTKPASTANASRNGVRMLKRDKSKKDKARKAAKKKKEAKSSVNPNSNSNLSQSIPQENKIPPERDELINIDPEDVNTRNNGPSISPSISSSMMDSYSESVGRKDGENNFEESLPGPESDDREGFLQNDNEFAFIEVRPDEEDYVPENRLKDEILHNREGYLPHDFKGESTDFNAVGMKPLPDADDHAKTKSRCSNDVKLLTRKGAKSVMTLDPILDAVEITHQDTSTVTMDLYQVWDNKPGYALDFLYYHFHEPGKHFWGNARCYEKTWVSHSTSRRVDTIQIACNRSQPYAELEICLVDNVSHATLFPSDPDYSSPEDKAVLPKMCKHETTLTELAACYKLKINCAPRSEDQTC